MTRLLNERNQAKGAWFLLPTLGLLLVTVLAVGRSSSPPTPSVRARDLVRACATNDDCPRLYCREEPCTVFECRSQECLVTTRTAAPAPLAPQTEPPFVNASLSEGTNMTSSTYTKMDNTTVVTTPAPIVATPPVNQGGSQSAPIFAGNDVCARAIGPISRTAQGLGNSRAILKEGTSIGAAMPTTFAPTCNSIRHTGPGVWYTVVGTGARMTASTCWSGSDYDTAISVYTGNRRRSLKKEDDKENISNAVASGGGGGCSSLQCVNANDDASGNFGSCRLNSYLSRVQWESNRGETYYVLIHGFNNRVGNFNLNVITARPLNERCSDAIYIPIRDEPIIGTTFQAELPWGANKATNCGELE